jgi:DnaK suppressor protein
MDKNQQRKNLLALQQTLLKAQETGDQAEETVELDQTRVGRLSRMDAMQAQAMSKETGRRRRQKLLQIEAALRRLEGDDYGFCQACGEEIAPARLEVDPAVLLCIDCASAREIADCE